MQKEDGWTALMITARHGGEHGAGMMRLLLDAGADANKQGEDGKTALMLAARPHCSESDDESEYDDSTSDGSESDAADRGVHAEAMVRLLVARGATLPRAADALHRNTPSALVSYLDGARSWTPLHRAADARDFSALFARLRERAPLHERHDDAVDSPHAHMRTALAIAASDEYACAAPVDERCVALLRLGAVWSIESHALCPADERTAASARTLMMGAKRVGADGERHTLDIGPATGGDGVARFVPRAIWGKIFRFLIFEEGFRDARSAKRRRTSQTSS